MKSEIVLTRNLAIETWRVKGSVATAKKRSELIPVLQHLKDSSGCTAKDMAAVLFNDEDARRVAAERLLDIADMLNLAENDRGKYLLTKDGATALQTEKVFVPEDGCWTLSVSDDPLLPHIIVKVEEHKEPNAVSEVFGEAKSKVPGRQDNMHPVPNWIKDCWGTELTPHTGGSEMRIDFLESRAESVTGRKSFRIEWDISNTRVRIFEAENIITQFPGPELTTDTIWKILLSNCDWLEDWDDREGTLKMAFGEVELGSRMLMTQDFEFEQPGIQNGGADFGIFENVTIRGVPISAATRDDADEWSRWRLNNSIREIAFAEKFQGWVDDALSPFKDFDLRLPDRDEYASLLWQQAISNPDADRAKAWNLKSASDWAL